jgi:DNA phosphorothioation-dependent restriction protein DptH
VDRLIEEIARHIREHVGFAAANLLRADGEIRSVFHGPPMEFLELVFERLVADGGIEVELGNGQPVTVPVLLQVDSLGAADPNPPLGESGRCDAIHLLEVRNSPGRCPRFIALVEPGSQSSLSFTSASDDFGLSPHNNSGAASTADWWRDEFVRRLVKGALDRHQWSPPGEREDAHDLIELAIQAADQIDKHVASRHAAWRVLARTWSIGEPGTPFGTLLSLACGFPPMEDGTVDMAAQRKVLLAITERFVDSGFKPAVEQLKERADAKDSAALDELLLYLQQKCGVPTVLGRAPAFYYGPSDGAKLDPAPGWWTVLTVEKWRHLLDGAEQAAPKGKALRLECHNSLLPSLGGMGPIIVTADAVLSVHNNGNVNGPSRVTIERKSARSPTQEWELEVTGDGTVVDPGEIPGSAYRLDDTDIPLHNAPVRYSVEAPGTKKTTLRVVSMQTWQPGLVVFSRTAAKLVLPRQARNRKSDKVALETSLTLSGEGRHYFDIHVRPGVTIGATATGSGDDGLLDVGNICPVSRVSDTAYGFEAVASGDCFYQVEVTQEPGADPEICRIYLACDEVATEDCSSEFERLIRANTRTSRTSTAVHVNRQLRCADLQGWMLAKDQAEHSYLPFVMAADYADHWRARDWSIDQPVETMITGGRFLHDPRPTRPEMAPSKKFVEARSAILERIRGDDDNGLIEAAPLGEWCANDPKFAELVEDYLQAYYEWLESAPESAAWCDVAIIASFESDDATLAQEPDAILVSPFHPVRLAWHCVAQRTLYLGQRKCPCPAASILDPDAVPDTLVLPLRTAAGGIKYQPFFSVECSSDYWAILWNGSRLDRVPQQGSKAPFDKEFGVLLGGISSGFSLSQVSRALDDIAEIFSAKPVLSISLSSAAGQNNACNEGIMEWCRERFGEVDSSVPLRSMGQRFIQMLDERPASTRPEDAEVSNLAEDTGNAVSWMSGTANMRPDLAIIAQLETSSPSLDMSDSRSPLGPGGLVRHRVRQQLGGGNGAFLTESRMASPRPPTGDGLLDKTAATLVRLENLGGTRYGYTFAPSVHAIRAALEKADYAAVSSSAVDPACFLGRWLEDTYLWDYELPSYSHRSGDNNGYYLLSKVKELDREALGTVLSKLPGCTSLDQETLEQVMLEVARRGIPTVRGLSRGDSGASGDLGLFLAARLIQDDFRLSASPGSLLPIVGPAGSDVQLALLIPVDPFRGYVEDLTRALGRSSYQRPDLVVAGITISDSKVVCRITPVEVKYRGGQDTMLAPARREALLQARSFSGFLTALQLQGNDPDQLTWRLAFQHLVSSMLGFAMRVYSQQPAPSTRETRWSTYHARIMEAVLSDEMELTIDPVGRLVVVDGSKASDALDLDDDGFAETIVLNRVHAGAIVNGVSAPVYALIKARVGDWRLLPTGGNTQPQAPVGPTAPGVPPPVNVIEPAASTRVNPEVLGKVEVNQLTGAPPAVPAEAIPGPGAPGKGIDLLIGKTLDGFEAEMRRLNLSDTNLNQLNIGVVGDLGTGKTQLLKSLVYQVVSSSVQNRGIRPRFLIFDYKKDYSSADFVQAVNARVVQPRHLPINLFDVAGAGNSMAPWLDRFKFFADVLDKIFSGVGPVQRQNLKTAVKQAYEDCEAAGRQPTIYDVHAKYRGIIGNKADSPFSIIDDLVDMEMFAREPAGGDAFDQFLDGVVVISLDALGQDDRTKNMLVAIMLNVFYEHMLRIPKRPFIGSAPQQRVVDSFLLVDEADNIMRYEFDVLRKVLLQGREFGVGVVLASQYLRHFKAGATDYREPLLTWLIHKVPNITPQELGALGLVGDVNRTSERIKSLPIHACLFKTFDVAGDVVRGTPFYEMVKRLENNKE